MHVSKCDAPVTFPGEGVGKLQQTSACWQSTFVATLLSACSAVASSLQACWVWCLVAVSEKNKQPRRSGTQKGYSAGGWFVSQRHSCLWWSFSSLLARHGRLSEHQQCFQHAQRNSTQNKNYSLLAPRQFLALNTNTDRRTSVRTSGTGLVMGLPPVATRIWFSRWRDLKYSFLSQHRLILFTDSITCTKNESLVQIQANKSSIEYIATGSLCSFKDPWPALTVHT